ncbi:MAG: TIGR01777 family protein [Actinobacteria bacterium HGW-Actinobacteria-4]|nr:MAG: TIGR01777 family protein [Actinobacteria bacterium HGW-Actinobacteria-4]
MKVVMGGASGLIGTALQESLRADGHEVIRLVRRDARGADESEWDPARGTIDAGVIHSADVVVNLAGASIGDKRLTDSYKKVVLKSRLDTTGLIARTMAATGSGVLIQASSLGYYGDKGDQIINERTAPGETFLSDIVTEWEAAAQPAIDAGVRTVFLRTGLVLAPHGGFAERLLPLVTRGLLRSLGSGDAWHSWITLHDHIRAVRFIIDSDHAGAVNIVAPIAVRNRELIRALSHAAGKGTLFSVPEWVLKVIVGPAIVDLLTSQLANPGVLKRHGFTWEFPEITSASEWIMSEAGHGPPTSPAPQAT